MKKFCYGFVMFAIWIANMLAIFGSYDKAIYIMICAFFTLYLIDNKWE